MFTVSEQFVEEWPYKNIVAATDKKLLFTLKAETLADAQKFVLEQMTAGKAAWPTPTGEVVVPQTSTEEYLSELQYIIERK